MRFQTGALGVVVVIVALVGMLMGSWVMSMDVTEEEVTKYNALTEIGGLFESEKTPTFTDYNPSTNYTGYYTSISVIGDTTYFDGVDFTEATNPNNFRVQGAPISTTVDHDFDLDTLTPTDTVRVSYFSTNAQTWNQRIMDDDANTMTMAEIAEALGYVSGNVKLTINNAQDPEDYSDFSDYVVFYTDDMIAGSGVFHGVWFKNPSLTGYLYQYGVNHSMGPNFVTTSSEVSNPIMGAVWDGISVTLYYDAECTRPVGTYTADAVSIAWGGTTGTASLNDVVDLVYLELPYPEYMDPSKGVVMA